MKDEEEMASTGNPHQRVDISDELATPGDTSQMPSPVHAARSIWKAADPEPQDEGAGYETGAAQETGPSGRGSLVPCLAMLAAATLVFLFCLVALLTAHGNSARRVNISSSDLTTTTKKIRIFV